MRESSSPDLIRENVRRVLREIEETCRECGRDPSEVALMAVTKTVPAEAVNQAVEAGVTLLGENRAQELLEKCGSYSLSADRIHFIGHLQTNKVRQIIDRVSMIESVGSIRLAREIERCCADRDKRMDILIEVNIAGEPTKSGVMPADLDELLEFVGGCGHLNLRGLMVIPPPGKSEEYFALAQKLLIDIKAKKLDNSCMNILSMGMSSDYREAIRYGSTEVRVGRGLFGERI